MTPQDAVNEATELCEAIFARPEDAVALVALKLGEISGRLERAEEYEVWWPGKAPSTDEVNELSPC